MGAIKLRLWAEFLAIFVLAPIGLAFGSYGKYLLPLMWIWTAIGIFLLVKTKGFSWSALWQRVGDRELMRLALMGVVMFITCVAITNYFYHDKLFDLPARSLPAWILVMMLYPPLSAFPQELMYRALFFSRYEAILPKGKTPLMLINAALFSFAHLIFMNPIVFILTFIGGLLFARAYLRGEFTMSVLLHAIAGNMIFTTGLGYLFYSGNLG